MCNCEVRDAVLIVYLDPRLFAEDQLSNDRDVVNDYHQRNRQPRAPDCEDLTEIRRQQRHSRTPVQPNPSDSSLSAQAAVTPGCLTEPAQKLQSYPNKFREVIKRAKLISQSECATKCPFPDRAAFLDTTSIECFNEALSECEDVPPGEL